MGGGEVIKINHFLKINSRLEFVWGISTTGKTMKDLLWFRWLTMCRVDLDIEMILKGCNKSPLGLMGAGKRNLPSKPIEELTR